MKFFAATEFKSTITYYDGSYESISGKVTQYHPTVEKIMVDTYKSLCIDDSDSLNLDIDIQFEVLYIPGFVKVGDEIFYSNGSSLLGIGIDLEEPAKSHYSNWVSSNMNRCTYKRLTNGYYSMNGERFSSRYEALGNMFMQRQPIVKIENGMCEAKIDPASL